MGMIETPDIRGITQHLGVGEETIAKMQEAGLIHATTLPAGSLRKVTPEDIDRMAAEGTLYSPWPKGLIERLAAGIEEKPEPPAA